MAEDDEIGDPDMDDLDVDEDIQYLNYVQAQQLHN